MATTEEKTFLGQVMNLEVSASDEQCSRVTAALRSYFPFSRVDIADDAVDDRALIDLVREFTSGVIAQVVNSEERSVASQSVKKL